MRKHARSSFWVLYYKRKKKTIELIAVFYKTPQDKEQGLPFYPFKEDKKLLAKSYDGW